ncbi:Ig-like domain-containing protein [Thalassolituus alkanivorans]|uniref:Ig-like domain-containing protein n=1 Tax=Thalassolituus alkanivorans TaxID=2881055 RepID=UPI001E4DE7D2|nr:Ig-like domain-containing protein [Thalassolituus alkanivorans]MCB2385359.1 Ig-like domain-containing protein [Thalassolituus alkanivorans]MCB2422242.1 Ig-like domain-containing protein [Thalassolituus alkanivorans]
MVKKTLLSLAIAATTAGLAGCNISSVEKHNNEVDSTPVDAGKPGVAPARVAPIFNPARAELPLATDFLLSGSTDGTLVYAKGDVDIIVDGATNPAYNPVFDAISDLDGFSTTGQLLIPFTGSLTAGDLSGGAAFLVPLNYVGGPKLGTLDAANPFDLTKLAKTAVKADVISFVDGDKENSVVRISPTTPLANNTRYLVVLTNQIKDAAGKATQMPSQYKYIIGDEDLLSSALAGARTAAKGWMELAKGYVSQVLSGDISTITLAYTFTTGGTVEVLSTMAAPGNADAALASSVPAMFQNYMNTTQDDAATQVATLTAAVGDSATAQTIYGGHQLLSELPAPAPRATDFSSAVGVSMATVLTGGTTTMYTGSIDLPYYSKAPIGAYSDDGVVLNPENNDNYVCADTSNAVCAAIKGSAANVVLGQWESDENVISTLKESTGSTPEEAAAFKAPSENVTNLFPFAKESGKVKAPVLVVEPEVGCAKPATGWKTVIFQHGIMGNRMQAIAVADQLGKSPYCFATVAIDLPMHGLMPKDKVSSGAYAGAPFNGALPLMAAVAESAGGTPVMTFAGLPAATQQQIISGETIKQRHFGLTADASSKPTAATGADTDQSGSLYITFLHLQATRDNNRQAVMDLLNLNASLPFMDLDGDGNGGLANTAPDFDKDNIYFAGISLGSIIGTQFVAVNNTNTSAANTAGNGALNRIQSAVFAVPGGGLPKLLENSQYFGPTILDGLSNNGLVRGSADFESLMYVYQSTVDSADPINFGGLMQLSQTPYTLIESIGDTVIPNNVAAAPLAGTDPLIAAFNATQVDTSSTLTASGQVAVKLADDYSSHGSFARPDTDPNTTETTATFGMLMQHTISLFMGAPSLNDGGAGIVVPVAE